MHQNIAVQSEDQPKTEEIKDESSKEDEKVESTKEE